MEVGLLLIRVVVGLFLAGHGAQKLFGWFGGHGPEGTGGFFESMGIRPGRAHATMAGLAEFGGGLLLALGFLTPLAAAVIGATMLVATLTAHRGKGPWTTNGGWELPAPYAAVAIGLAFNGAGEWSLDNALALDLNGVTWGLAAVAAALVGAAGVLAQQRRPEPVHPATG